MWYSLGTVNGGDYDNGQGAGQIGSILEKRRLEKGLSLKEVEQATKIRTRYLEGLEREDPTVLPDPVYARGFLKTYANFLGLDGERLSRELRDRRSPRRERQLNQEAPGTSDFEQPLITPGGVGGAERKRISGATILTVALAVLLLAAVIGALYYVGSRSAGSGAEDAPEEPAVEQEDPGPPQKEEPATETTTGGATGGTEDEAEDAASETAPVTVRVIGAPAGLTVTVDGAVALDQFAQPGFSQTFEARNSVTVSTANAGAVEVEVDGQNQGRLGRNGQGATREFPVQPAG
ncbi:MAG: Transcriptional regulator [uncultured Rubrobacteraceae bacterium]|uniref:Transcriptional regulator n=1 Tax=uncultured Rubrobacteraceae bacterium TaxID=349277 RepID=A0A6J4Q1N8_9ACTN|nr:MAG: Transcriptional regulator [uncultured Rubrobacteraceae bacterium]